MSGDEQTCKEPAENRGCKHYERSCQLRAPCCHKFYTCRFCHNEEEDHELNRKAVVEVKCMNCSNIQAPSSKCESCEELFGNYYCSECNFFDHKSRKQFHCDKCGICRIGGKENYFHCEKCDVCLSLDIKTSHKCYESVSRKNCPVCLENLHTSTIPSHVPHCSHMIHITCFKEMLKNGNYACPICSESIIEMDAVWRELDEEVAATPMPDEYINLKVDILCRDCHKESEVSFHVLGLKCKHCLSYNTCRTGSNNSSLS